MSFQAFVIRLILVNDALQSWFVIDEDELSN